MAAVFSVQSDAGDVADANAYVSLEYFRQYHEDRGNALAGTDAALQAAIVRATDYIDTRFVFPGSKLTGDSQTTQWPRANVYVSGDCVYGQPGWSYPYYDAVTGYYYYDSYSLPMIAGIPSALKKATCEYALRAISSGLFVDAVAPENGRAIRRKRVKVDVIETETEYEPTSSATPGVIGISSYPSADLLLARAGLLANNSRTVMR